MIDPEAGIEISEFQGTGQVESSFGGSGEAFDAGLSDWQAGNRNQMFDWIDRQYAASLEPKKKRRDKEFYEQVGAAMMQEDIQRQAIDLASGFDMNWLGRQMSAGSAEGQHL